MQDLPKPPRGRRRQLRAPVLESLAPHVPVGIYVTDTRGHALYLNAQACRIIGLPRERALGEGWLSAVHPGDERRVLRGRTRAVTPGTVFRARFRFLGRDGRVTWAQAITVPTRDARGRVLGRVGLLLDVTAQHRPETVTAARPRKEALSAQERRVLELVVEGRTNKEIARRLSLSDKTVKNYLSNAYQKLRVSRRSQAAAVFARRGGDAD